VPLVDNMGLGIALLSCEGRLHWGINADYDLVPDLTDFVAALQDAFQELAVLARQSGPAPGRAPRRGSAAAAPDGANA
jgi:hypothetical protein